jgi:hypothetical protein
MHPSAFDETEAVLSATVDGKKKGNSVSSLAGVGRQEK